MPPWWAVLTVKNHYIPSATKFSIVNRYLCTGTKFRSVSTSVSGTDYYSCSMRACMRARDQVPISHLGDSGLQAQIRVQGARIRPGENSNSRAPIFTVQLYMVFQY